MKTRMALVALAFCFAGAVMCFASDPNVGTWKLNESKSTIPAGVPKNITIVYTVAGDQYKGVSDGLDGAGKPMHNEWTGNFDGKDYPVTGDSSVDTRSIQKVDSRHYKAVNKKGGTTTSTATIEFSPDGKTRTLVVHRADSSGKPASATFVYDKQ